MARKKAMTVLRDVGSWFSLVALLGGCNAIFGLEEAAGSLTACEADEDCSGDEACVEGECRGSAAACEDCDEGESCVEGVCVSDAGSSTLPDDDSEPDDDVAGDDDGPDDDSSDDDLVDDDDGPDDDVASDDDGSGDDDVDVDDDSGDDDLVDDDGSAADDDLEDDDSGDDDLVDDDGSAADDDGNVDSGSPDDDCPVGQGCECAEGDTRACSEGGFRGTCADGTQTCDANGEWGACDVEPMAGDTCDPGNDDNCNGVANEGCACEDGSERSCALGGLVGPCADGTQVCDGEAWGECDISPAANDTCDPGNDDNCNGVENEDCACEDGAERDCSEGGLFGKCASGTQTCDDGDWSSCTIQPSAEDTCDPNNDDNCNGIQNEGCPCTQGQVRSCSEGGFAGPCASGMQTCNADGAWGSCSVAPAMYDTCAAGNDANCNGQPNLPLDPSCQCVGGTTRSCSQGGLVGPCATGTQTCTAQGTWANCSILPATGDTCTAGNDANCNGMANEGCLCLTGAAECVGGPPATQRRTCSAAGTWNTPTSCDYVCTGDGVCGGICSPGDTHCVSNGTAEETCNDQGQWGSSLTCPFACVNDECGGQCVPSEVECLDSTDYQVCNPTTAMWGPPQTCEFACYQNECTGDCVPDTPICISGDAYVCDETGTNELDDDCTPPGEICREGVCEANDPYVVGENSIAGYSNFNTPVNDRMYILPLAVPTTAVLLTFRVFVQSGSGNVRMVLYADDSGQPGAQVKRSVLGTVASATNGVVSMNAEGGNVQLTGGSTYWLGVVFFESGGAVETYSRTSTGLQGFSVPQAIGANPYADPFDIDNASAFNNIQLPIAIGVQDVSQ